MRKISVNPQSYKIINISEYELSDPAVFEVSGSFFQRRQKCILEFYCVML